TLPDEPETQDALIYLEVWQRLITYLEDDTLREIALGGPDTTTRLKTVAQVKVLPIPRGEREPTCDTVQLPRPGQGTLTTLQPSDALPVDPCRLPDPATYTGRENHLYRVEIHDGGDVIGSNTGRVFRIRLQQDAPAGAVSLTLATALSQAQADALQRSGLVTL